jgi:peptidoglycan/xylan/chitin deacetylase (PgdA/CDA1 family)
MGAKARAWFSRGLLVLVVVAGVLLVLGLPGIPAWGRAVMLLVGFGVGVGIAFRQIPAFDPLGRVRWRVPGRDARVCALSFDDGPSAETMRLLDILARCQIKATFFVLADKARRHPDVLRRLAAEGHTVALHGNSHAKLHRASEAQIERELSAAVRGLHELGVTPVRLYRPPHGLKNSAVFRVTKRLGFQIWAWSRGIWDTDGPAPEVLVRRATRFACSGMVLLLHDGRGNEEKPNIEPMLSALPLIVERLRSRGFGFVTLDQV